MSKEAIRQRADELAPELFAISDFIHANPELGHQEFKAQARLVGEFQGHGFDVKKGVGGFETSFKATLPHLKEGPTVAFLAEYDALPELGHGCGHNVNCTAALGAALALRPSMVGLRGNIVVIGTPAEEGASPPVKPTMIERGVFDGVDVAMLSHARDRTCTGGRLLAIDTLEFHFKGKASHASISPEEGISALDAALLTMHGIELLREHVRSDVRLHGIITDGGQAANVVPERASIKYYVRAQDRSYLDKVIPRVENCALAGALATGAEVTINNLGKLDNRLNVETLNQLLLENARLAGAQRIKPHPPSLGSADFGNVTHRMPAATLYVEVVPEGVGLHTKEMREAAGGASGHRGLLIGAKAMACTAFDILTDADLLDQIKSEFAQTKGESN
jgi:amidohydrolase